MIHYIIDGNNLIGYIIPDLKNQLKNNKQKCRTDLVYLLNQYFYNKKVIISLHFDGFENEKLRIGNGKIYYSKNLEADLMIRKEIDKTKSKRLITLITSDLSLIEYAKVNGCNYMTSKEFYENITNSFQIDEEEEKIKELEKDKEMFKKIFRL